MTYHGTVCYQTDKGVGWDQAKTDNEGITEGLQVFLVKAGIDDEKENGALGHPGEGVLYGSVFW